ARGAVHRLRAGRRVRRRGVGGTDAHGRDERRRLLLLDLAAEPHRRHGRRRHAPADRARVSRDARLLRHGRREEVRGDLRGGRAVRRGLDRGRARRGRVRAGPPGIRPETMSRIDARARFDIIRYANSWEDADVLCAALRPAPGKRMLAIASAGDNAFALLAAGAEVVAADLSAAQLALVELKRAAIRQLDDDALLHFLGAPPS